VKAREKIKPLDELAPIIEREREAGKKIVLTNGCFDLLHPGHIRALEEAKGKGEVLVVALNSDRSVRALKGPGRPILPQEARAELVAALWCVDYVTIFDELRPDNVIRAIRPHVHVKSAEYKAEELPERKAVEEVGGRVELVSYIGGWSTSSIIQRIRRGPSRPPLVRVVAVIPARFSSSRFPGKALADIAGKPMIQWVYERASQARRVSRVIVATDDERILEAVRAFGGEAVMTSPEHPTGTDRVAEVVERLLPHEEAIVNVQGDEPLIDPSEIDAAVEALSSDPDADMSTLASPIESEEVFRNPNAVKVVCDRRGYALYFSRSPIPFYRGEGRPPQPLLHVGLYCYRREALLRLVRLPRSPLEEAESLEQLRALENGMRIKVALVPHHEPGVDTPEDLERVRRRVGS